MAETPNLGPMPPHGRMEHFLAERDRQALFEWAVSEQSRFKPARVFYHAGNFARTDPRTRLALKRKGAGPIEPVLRSTLFAALPEIAAMVGYNGPQPSSIEFEINAYGDGAHFAPHIDIPLGQARKPMGANPGEDRVITAIYYFHSEPKVFSGGALRLYRFGADPAAEMPDLSIEFEPEQNSLLVFPSWAKHAVERVRCPTDRFADFRFAINCWFCRRLGA